MDVRFEADMAEVAGDGNYLMICAGRKTVFMDGVDAGRVPLDEVGAIAVDGSALVVHLQDGGVRRCPLPSETESDLEALAARLAGCVAQWR